MKETRTHSIRPTLRGLVLALAVIALSSFVASAHPYASGISVSSGTVTWYLNENATDVKIVYSTPGTATHDLGPMYSGPQSFSLTYNSVLYSAYSIVVNNTGAGTWSEQTNTAAGGGPTLTWFRRPVGVTVNNNPKTGNFGRIYVANSLAGTTANRVMVPGIFALNADISDAFGYGNTAKTAGMILGTSATSYSPWRLSVGSDDALYAADADSTGLGGSSGFGYSVWMVNPNLVSSTQLFPQANTANGPDGVTSKPVAKGSYAAGNLVLDCISWDQSSSVGYNAVLQFPINGSTLPYTTPATPLVAAAPGSSSSPAINLNWPMDMDIDPVSGNIFTIQYVGGDGGSTIPCLRVLKSDGSQVLWDSWTDGYAPINLDTANNNNPADPWNYQSSIAVSPDGKFVASMIINGRIVVLPLVNGIPDYNYNNGTPIQDTTGLPIYLPSNPIIPSGTSGNQAQQIAFDAADNIYTVSRGQQRLRAFSLGMTTTATTFNDNTGNNGTFTFGFPSTTVSVVASQADASQSGPTPGQFIITRAGQDTANLTVNFTLSGTATNGVYTASGPTTPVTYPTSTSPTAANTVTILAGHYSTNITINPTPGSTPLPIMTAVLTLVGGAGYNAASPTSDTVYITNTVTPQLVMSAGAPSMYKAFSNDYASVTLTRLGNPNVPLTVAPLATSGGSAAVNVDFTTPTAVTFAPLDITKTAQISPLVNGAVPTHALGNPYVGNKTALIGFGSGGSGYTTSGGPIGLTIIDDANPPATVLWSDPLNTPLGGDNGNDDTYAQWNITYANNNMDGNAGPDYTAYNANFGYDLTSGGIGGTAGVIPLPPNGSQYALRTTVNKVLGQSAGVNFYPTNAGSSPLSFSGNYAIRFNMNVVEEADSAALNYTTEGPIFGMNHNGTLTNWWSGSGVTDPVNTPYPWASDGIWCWICAGAGGNGSGDYLLFSGATGKLPNTGWMYLQEDVYAPTFSNYFKGPTLYTSVPGIAGDYGVPANQSPLYGALISSASVPPNTWSDVELKQVGSNVTFSINKTPIFTYVNTNSFTSGVPMFGYDDPFSSKGSADGAAYFSNVRVVQLPPMGIIITNIVLSGPNVVMRFTSTDSDDTAASFTLQSSGTVNEPPSYADVSPAATFIDLGGEAFQVTYPQNGSPRFYRIKHN
jgi:hypothetical protein